MVLFTKPMRSKISLTETAEEEGTGTGLAGGIL